MSLAPIVLFVYNRPEHTRQTLDALAKNILAKESELFIFSDAPKSANTLSKVEEVRKCIRNVSGFKKVTIVEREKNLGLANSIIDGVTKVIDQYEKIIVLEDDLVTSRYFLKFMNEALDVYKTREDIFSITGFNYPKSVLDISAEYEGDVYLSYRCMSWSWGTWKDRWDKVDWEVENFEKLKNDVKEIRKFNRGGEDLFTMLKSQMEGKLDSWAIRFCLAHSLNESYCVYPTVSYINNEGFDGSGVHCNMDKSNRLKNDELNEKEQLLINKNIELDMKIVENFYKITKRSFFSKLKGFLRRYI